MFQDQIQTNGDVIKDSTTIEIPSKLVYLMLFHLITPHKALSMRKEWNFLSKGKLRFTFWRLFGRRQ